MKKHLGFIIFFGCIIFIFLGKLILMKEAFIYGDYLQQFYPWSKIYSESIKNFQFPYWTSYMQSGFPLMAEGQIGGFYPLNILMFFLLPFKMAYNYSVILHFILAGIFTYMYTRKIGADEWGGCLAALLFCFGSAYAGCFYNTVVVRTVAWFPFVLFLAERYFETKKIKFIIFSGCVIGMQLLAGFAQMALYSIFFYLLYMLYGLKINSKVTIKDIILLGIMLSVAFIIFYPQFVLSSQLIKLSNRVNLSLGFALWGSFSPMNFMSLYFPYFVFWGTKFYIGVLSLLFLIYSFSFLKNDKKIKSIFLVLLVSVFFAIGSFNPIYIFLVKITKTYFFRNPSKWLMFGIFAASVLSGYGFTKFFQYGNDVIKSKALKIFVLITGCSIGLFCLIKLILITCKTYILDIGDWYVNKFVIGKQFHRYEATEYIGRVKNFYDSLNSNSSPYNIYVLFSVFLSIFLLCFVISLYKKKRLELYIKYICFIIVFADLYIFSLYGTGFRGNIKSFEYLSPECPKIFNQIKSDPEIFRIVPFNIASNKLPNWATPNANMLYGIDSIAAYSPLTNKIYRDKLKNLEVVDDSLGLKQAEPRTLSENIEILKLLNVKYIVSSVKLDASEFQLINSEKDIFLYKISNYFPRVFFVTNIEEKIEPNMSTNIKLTNYDNGLANIEINTAKDGYVVFSENYYPGWNVYVDGIKKDLIRFRELIQAVAIKQGNHKVIFRFKPALT